MGGSLHDSRALAQFQQGETRLVFARRRGDPHSDLFYLEDGQADEKRQYTIDDLECFMPQCDNRRLTTVSRRRGRDGFRHMSGAGGHSDESLFHAQAKELLRRWALAQDSDAEVMIERATDSRARRADVMIRWSDRALPKLAIEVQYSGLAVKTWQERHDSYLEQGIVDLWLFGHAGGHFRAKRADASPEPTHDQVRLSHVHRAVLEAGLPLLWINPISALVGTASVPSREYSCESAACVHPRLSREYFVLPSNDDPIAWFHVDRLDACTPHILGMTTPRLGFLRDERDKLTAEIEAHHAEMERRRAASRARAAEDQRLRDWHAQHRPQLERQWANSQLHQMLLQEHAGAVPMELAASDPSQDAIYAVPEHWHSLLYATHVMGKDSGHRFTIADCYRTLSRSRIQLHPEGWRRSAALVWYLKHLARAGVVVLRGSKDRIDGITVKQSIKAVQEARALAEAAAAVRATARQRETEALRRSVGKGRPDQLSGLDDDQQLWRRGWADTDLMRVADHYCLKCGLPLDPILAKHGYHLGCD